MTPLIVAVAPVQAGPDLDRVADCIKAVENRRNHPLGRHGERGAYQLTLAAWQEETDAPFALAENEAFARGIVIARLRHIEGFLRARGIPITCYRLGIAYNAGMTACILGRWINESVKSYGVRLENLYLDRVGLALSPP